MSISREAKYMWAATLVFLMLLLAFSLYLKYGWRYGLK